MRIFHSTHQHPLTFKQIIVDVKGIRLVLFCEECRQHLNQRIPDDAIQSGKKEE